MARVWSGDIRSHLTLSTTRRNPIYGKKTRTPRHLALHQRLTSPNEAESLNKVTVGRHNSTYPHQVCNHGILDQLADEIPYQLAEHILPKLQEILWLTPSSYIIKISDHRDKYMQLLCNYSLILSNSLYSLYSPIYWLERCSGCHWHSPSHVLFLVHHPIIVQFCSD